MSGFKNAAEKIGIALAVCFFAPLYVVGTIAWLAILPTIGLLWSIGWLK